MVLTRIFSGAYSFAIDLLRLIPAARLTEVGKRCCPGALPAPAAKLWKKLIDFAAQGAVGLLPGCLTQTALDTALSSTQLTGRIVAYYRGVGRGYSAIRSR